MDAARPKPIVSLHADDPEWDEAISSFVIGLGERIDDLQDAEAAGSTERLRSLAESLCDDAGQVGYPAVADAALRVREACGDVPDARRKAVVDLTELTQRVRRGHRSAA